MPYQKLLQTLANEADAIASHYFDKASLTIKTKSDLSPVSNADLEIEQTIRKYLATYWPDISILGEEFGQCDPSSPLKLIIDPIDGTRNFIRNIPFFATLLAIEKDQEIISGMISAPALNQRWAAHKSAGATLNGTPIHTSSIADLSQAQAFHGSLWGNEASTLPYLSVTKLLSQTQRQRGFGDFMSHVMIANGCGEFSIDFGLKPWDIAPLKCIVEEAGGQVTNANNQFSLYSDSLICSNKFIHPKVLAYFTT